MMVQNIVISHIIRIFSLELWNKINLLFIFLISLSCYQSLKVRGAWISLRWNSFGYNLVDFRLLALVYLIKSLIQSLYYLPISLILFLVQSKLIIFFFLLYILLQIYLTLFWLYFGLLYRIHFTIIFVKLNILNVFIVGWSIIFKFYLRFRVVWPAIANVNIITYWLRDRSGGLYLSLLLIGLKLLISLCVNLRLLKFICLYFQLIIWLFFFRISCFGLIVLLLKFFLLLLKLNFWWWVWMVLIHSACISAFF